MKKQFIKFMAIVLVAMGMGLTAGCERTENEGRFGRDYYYNLYTDYQNYNNSSFNDFQPLWDVNDQGDEVVWMRTFHGTREACDQMAVEAFEQILSQIDDQSACANLHGDDYMTAIMQRVEGGPHDLKDKTWTADGVR